MGSFFDVMGERNLITLNDAWICSNFSTTCSIVGRIAGFSSVIASTRSFMNSKPVYFYNFSLTSRKAEAMSVIPS